MMFVLQDGGINLGNGDIRSWHRGQRVSEKDVEQLGIAARPEKPDDPPYRNMLEYEHGEKLGREPLSTR